MPNPNLRESRATGGPKASILLPPNPLSPENQLFPRPQRSQEPQHTVTQVPKTAWAAAAAKAARVTVPAVDPNPSLAVARADTAKETAARRFTYNSGYKGLGPAALSQMLGITPGHAQSIIDYCQSQTDYNTCVGQSVSKGSSLPSRNARPSLIAPKETIPCGRFTDMMRQKRTNRRPFSEEDNQDAKRCNVNLMMLQPFDTTSIGLHAKEFKWVKRGPDEVGDEWFEEIGNKDNTMWLPPGWYIHTHDGITEYADPNGNMYPTLPDYIGFDGMGHWGKKLEAVAKVANTKAALPYAGAAYWLRNQQERGGKRHTKRKSHAKKTRVKKSRRKHRV